MKAGRLVDVCLEACLNQTTLRAQPSYKTPVPWQESTELQLVEYQLAYAPVFIGHTAELPRYDERFWQGNYQVQQCYDTVAAGFKFFVLPPSVGTLIRWKQVLPRNAPLRMATTRVPMGLLASTIRRVECVWPGARDGFVCDSDSVRKSVLWYRLITPAIYKIVGCKNTEQRLLRASKTITRLWMPLIRWSTG